MVDFENAMEIRDLSKKFDGFSMEDLSFILPKGSIMGFIGQNGAGKTTTIKSILNIIKKDSGSIKLLGLDSVENETEIKQRISVVLDEMPFHDDFNAMNIRYILKNIYPKWDDATYERYLDRFNLPRKKKIGQFSKGMRMKLQIACALSHNAELLIMDEATTGLDPVVRNEILDIFLEYIQDENRSILMSSHITSDLERIADCITFIDNGRLLLTGYKDEILENHGVIKCSNADLENIDKSDIVSIRRSEFGAEAMIFDKPSCKLKYPKMVIDNTTLEDIMLFYVNRSKEERSK